MRWYDLTLEGRASHAGTTPMEMRSDASVAAAKIIVAVNRLAGEIGDGALTTTGVIDAYPNSRNVVPSRVFMTVDLRHTKIEVLEVRWPSGKRATLRDVKVDQILTLEE